MATWRRKAIGLFPDLRSELNDREYGIYQLFSDLRPMVREAHDSGQHEMLRRIYGFASWCLDQNAKDVWNAAGVSFYEHLFDDRKYWEAVIPWLSPEVIKECWGLWESRLSQSDFEELKGPLRASIRHLPR